MQKKGWSTNTHPSEYQDCVHYDTQTLAKEQSQEIIEIQDF